MPWNSFRNSPPFQTNEKKDLDVPNVDLILERTQICTPPACTGLAAKSQLYRGGCCVNPNFCAKAIDMVPVICVSTAALLQAASSEKNRSSVWRCLFTQTILLCEHGPSVALVGLTCSEGDQGRATYKWEQAHHISSFCLSTTSKFLRMLGSVFSSILLLYVQHHVWKNRWCFILIPNLSVFMFSYTGNSNA